jgi:hypothetical protein
MMTKPLDAEIDRALNRGATVTENGVSRWIDDFHVMNKGKTGSELYVWRGDKVRIERVLMTKDAKGNVTRKSLGFKWGEPV